MGTAVGIDLGTTNTVVAVVRDGKPEALPDDAGGKLIPSFVSFHPNGGVLVGRRARERRKIDAENTVYSVKRLIGRRWQSDEVQRAKGLFPFKLKESAEHLPLVVARGAAYALHTISSLVLKRAKKVAEKALGGAVDNAVITVPASFNELQRAATKNAGTEAGLKVLRILNEPTAAALAYGLGRAGGVDGGAERVAVYDLGGGTFDLTLLDLSGSVIEVIATAGDNFLGGDDIDHLILGQLVDEVLQQTRVDPRNDVQLMERLRAEAEQIKIGLSSTNEVAVEMQEIGYGAGGIALKAEFSMRRSELEVLAAPLVERSIDVCKRAMELGRLDVDAFDRIILVGGSTRMPLVRQMVEAYFGKLPLDEMNPDEVVALGAAIQAQSLAEADERRGGAIVQAAARRFHAPSVPRATPPALPGAKVPLPSDLGLAPAAGGVLPPAAPAPRKPPGPPPITVRGTQTVQVGGPPVPAAPAPFPAFITGDDTPPLSLPNPSVPEPPMFPPPPQAADAFARTAVMAAISPKVPDRLPGIAPAMRAPLLIDVTPLTLAVETVGGFVDSVIPRNTAVPSAQTRTFTTSKDNQTDVVVRVCQGESQTFGANVFLGELQLSGIRAARRGEASIEVTFELDADGMLQVRALDLESRKEIRTSMKMDAAQSAGG